MSKGPTGTGETCMEVIKKGRINIRLKKDDWCTYEGTCEYERMISKECICWHCDYMQKFDIPAIIQSKMEE